jgi:hypothetical protein
MRRGTPYPAAWVRNNGLFCCKKFLRWRFYGTKRPLWFTASRPSQEAADKAAEGAEKAADAAADAVEKAGDTAEKAVQEHDHSFRII